MRSNDDHERPASRPPSGPASDQPGSGSSTSVGAGAKILRSQRFLAPGTPLPLRRRLAVHNAVVDRIRAFLRGRGHVEVPVPALSAATGSAEVMDSTFSLDYFGDLAFPRQSGQVLLDQMVCEGLDRVYCESRSLRREWKVDERHLADFKLVEVEGRDLELPDVIALQEDLLKDVIRHLDADLLGGAHVTRLDRVLHREHPRLSYQEALNALNRRGWSMPFGEDFHRDAEAALVRYCGNLPVHVTHLPGSLELFNVRRSAGDPRTVECADYILPFAGETCSGAVYESDPAELSRRLYGGSMYAHLMRRAQEVAALRAAMAAPAARSPERGREESFDERSTSVESLTARYQRGIAASFARYLGLFDGPELRRGGFGLGVARLLQYCMGLDSIKQAVVFPLDRRSFAIHGGDEDELASAAGIA